MRETAEILILILVANGTPVVVSFLFSHKMSLAIDFGFKLKDQQFLFGNTKTWRGVIAALFVTTLVSMILDYELVVGLIISLLAMGGDLFSSFVKRRLKKASGSRVLFLDQVPESALPALAMIPVIGLDLIQVIVIVVAFIIIELLLSIVLFRIGIRKHPY